MSAVSSLSQTKYSDTIGTNYMRMPLAAQSLPLNSSQNNFYYPKSDQEFELWAAREIRVFNCYVFDPSSEWAVWILQTIIIPMFTKTRSRVCVIDAAYCPNSFVKYRNVDGSPVRLMRMYRTHIMRVFTQMFSWQNVFRFSTAFLDYRNGHISRGFDCNQT